MFTAATGLAGTWLVADQRGTLPEPFGDRRWAAIAVGVLYGGLIAFSVIEARMAWMALPMALVPLGFWSHFWRRSGLSLRRFFWGRQFTALVAVAAVAAVALTAAYGIANAGFPQPSEL